MRRQPKSGPRDDGCSLKVGAMEKESSLQLSNEAHSASPTSLPVGGVTLLDIITSCLEDNKAEEITSINLSGKTSITDHMVIANGRSARQVAALADHLLRRLKDAGLGSLHAEGLPQADWVLIDAGDVLIHLFRPEVRSFYNLEKMWSADLSGDDLVN